MVMPFEIVPTPHLPPHTCICCGCAKDEPHAFIPQTAPWEYNYPFLCRTCVTEMAGAMGITKETVTNTVEVVRTPTPEEVAFYIGAHYTLTPTAERSLAVEVATCPCGQEFTGPTAKAKLGSHKRTCDIAKMADLRGGEAAGKAVAADGA